MPDIVGSFTRMIRVDHDHTVDLAANRCTVEIGDPDAGGFITVPIQWLALYAEATIDWSPPTVSEQGLFHCPNYDVSQGAFLCGLYCSAFPTPDSTAREFTRYADHTEFGYPDNLYDQALPGCLKVERAAFADGALPRNEVLSFNPHLTARHPRPSLLKIVR